MRSPPVPVFVLALASMALAAQGHSVIAQQRPDVAPLEATTRAELQATATPGAAVAVVNGARVVFLKGFGVASLETGGSIAPATLFYSGGLSRLFTAATLLSLADEGKVDLDAPIGRYVAGLSPRLAQVTAHQLLTSTAGLREQHLRHSIIEDDELRKLVLSWGDDRFFTEPGRIHSGSHLGWATIGLLVEAVAEKPFADAVHERVFAPLGMTRTTYRPLVAVTYPFSQGHERAPDGRMRVARPFAGNSVGLPRGSFYSGDDAARFMIALLDGGRLDGRQVLRAPVVARLLRPYVPSPAADDQEEGYGVRFASHAGQRVLAVNSNWGGVATAVRIVPERRFAVISMANGDVHLRRTIDAAMRAFLPPPSGPVAEPARVPLKLPEAARYAGTYENERVLRLFVRDGALVVRDESVHENLGSETDGEAWPIARIGVRDLIATQPGTSRSLRFRMIEGTDGRIQYLIYGGRALISAAGLNGR